jgi:hypothetical protein
MLYVLGALAVAAGLICANYHLLSERAGAPIDRLGSIVGCRAFVLVGKSITRTFCTATSRDGFAQSGHSDLRAGISAKCHKRTSFPDRHVYS